MAKETKRINVFYEILEWSHSLPNWESDALRRIIENINYSDKDITKVLQLLKYEHGLIQEDGFSGEAIRLSKEHLPAHSEASRKVLLKSIHDIENVNAILAGQKVDFLPNGLTIIYGKNAAGKSGYARVLKKACRARGEKKPILPDVFSKVDETKKPVALIDINDEGEDKTLKWKDGESFFDELGCISFFDSNCARVYVDEANKVSYLPYGLDIFDKLCKFLEDLKEKLQNELASISADNSFLENFPVKTDIYKKLIKINENTKVEEIDELEKFKKNEEQKLKKLGEKLFEAKKQDPKVKAESIRRKKRRIEDVKNNIRLVSNTISEREIESFKNLHREYIDSEKATEIASKITFEKEPLSGVGTGPWRTLFQAAKEYSEKYAYPGERFPYLGEDSLCVLCFQKLNSEALKRFQKFKDFVEDRTAQMYKENKKRFEEKWNVINGIKEKLTKDYSDVINEIKEKNSDIAKEVVSFLRNSIDRYIAIEESVEKMEWNTLPRTYKSPSDAIGTICHQLEKEAEEYDEIANSGEMEKLESEYDELNSKNILRNNRERIKKYIDNLSKITNIKECIRETITTGVSRKCTELMEVLITERLKEELMKEFKILDIDYLRVDLKKLGRAGVTFHQFKLQSDKYRETNLSEVLSEGEQGAIAIAAFLAELQGSGICSGIVFDDPISSLDQPRRERVAKRLVYEASKRQIIIFTHDIVFLTELESEALRNEIDYKIQTIWSNQAGIGYCDPSAPWIAQNVKKRIGYLKGNLLPKLEKMHKSPNVKEEYKIRVEDFFKKLRETWERAIEEIVFNDTIQRFRDSVETNRLKSVKFDDNDYKEINEGMTISSEYLHDRARAKGEKDTDVSVLRKEINKLESFVDIKRNQLKEVRKNR